MILTQVYAPNATSEYHTFVDEVNDALLRVSATESTVLMGDFNAHVGTDADTWKGVIGKHGVTGLNEVEASHAYAHARAIAFFSCIRFKSDILSQHCCKLRSGVVSMLAYQPYAPGSDSRMGDKCVMQKLGRICMYSRFLASKPCIRPGSHAKVFANFLASIV